MVSFALAPGIRFNDLVFTEPVALEGWTAPQFAGLYALLRSDGNWAPKAFQPLFFGEFGNRTPAGTFFRDCESILRNAGDGALFVALLPMPFSTTSQRWATCSELVRAYHPLYQTEVAMPSGNPMAIEVPVPPRRRIGFLPQTETA